MSREPPAGMPVRAAFAFAARFVRKEVPVAVGVLVLNAGYEPLHTVSLPHAVRMLVRQVAVVHESDGPDLGVFPRPKVVRLLRYVVMKWRYAGPPRWSRAGVLRRDRHACAYCGRRATTVDHIVPISRGGPRTSWLNTVAACGGSARSCNARKADRTPEEAGLALRFPPRVPRWEELHPLAGLST